MGLFDKKAPEPVTESVTAPLAVEKFYRIKELPLPAGDTFRGYQVEEITVCEDIVVDRKMVDRPNLFEYAQTHAVDLMDPRNVRAAEVAE